MKIKICGLSREQDIDYVNEARPDYAGFVFAESRRKVSFAVAARLRRNLLNEIVPVGVFVNAPIDDIAAVYFENVIAIAQLHGTETDEYIMRLKEASAAGGRKPVEVIKTVKSAELEKNAPLAAEAEPAAETRRGRGSPPDYYLIDSGAGSGKTFNWDLLNSFAVKKPWFLAGGVGLGNIERAMALNPFALDVSSGVETRGVKDREKIIQLVSIARKGIQRNNV